MSLLYVSLFQILIFCSFSSVKGLQETDRRLNELEQLIKTQQNQLNTQQNQLNTQQNQLNTQQVQLDNLRAEKDAEIENLRNRNDDLAAGKPVYQVHDGMAIFKRFQEPANVAFYVYLSRSRCYSNHETIIFDVQETNIENGYNGNDGIFDAPVTGTYVFTVTLGSNYNTYVTAEIVVNGQVKGTAFANSEEIHDLHGGSGTIVVHVNAGDHVFVRRGDATNNCSIYSSASYVWTAFSGWLLF